MKGSLLLYNLKLNCLIFSTSLNSSLFIFVRTYTGYCKLSKCIGQTLCSYEHYLVYVRKPNNFRALDLEYLSEKNKPEFNFYFTENMKIY